MRLTPTTIDGVLLVESATHADARGVYAQTYDAQVFGRAGLPTAVTATAQSTDHRAGTVHGLHRQRPPFPQGKLVRCLTGAIADVALDLRLGSATFGQHLMVELSEANGLSLFVPPYVAHGFQTLTDAATVLHQVAGDHVPEAQEGYRFDDPALAIGWPLPVSCVSEEDSSWPLLGGRRYATV